MEASKVAFIFSLLKRPFYFGTVFFLFVGSIVGQDLDRIRTEEGKVIIKQNEIIRVDGAVFSGELRQGGFDDGSYTKFTIDRGYIVESRQYGDGKLVVRCDFRDGLVHGACDYYCPEGDVQFKLIFESGKYIHEIFIQECKSDVL